MTPDLGDADSRPDELPASVPGAAAPRRSPLLRTLVLAGVVVVAVVAGALLANRLAGDPGPVRSDTAAGDVPARLDAGPRSGSESLPLPQATLEGFGGGPAIDLTSYRGTPLLVNFWATWCAPCVEEMPAIQQVADAFGPRLAVLGVNVQDAATNAEPFVEELAVTYDLAVDPSGELYADVRAFGMPTTLLVDAEGTIVYRHTGPLDDDEFVALVAEHLHVTPPERAPAAEPAAAS